jgi:NAD(P)-dependent dehydrogenase (short-subunit alcohol dehydrogenase family)
MSTVSIVTGGSRGLGRNTAISIARHGGDVILTYRHGSDQAKAVVAEIEALGQKAVALQLDVTNVSSFNAFTDHVRKTLSTSWNRNTFDHLVNNAGQGEMASFADTTEA